MSSVPYFSVIMPSYGVEKYLETAVNSVLSQTFCDCEIIIVDDASPDLTGEIADSLAKKHDNIRVIHHETNRGLSEARNTGLRAALGCFVFFADPDDFVEPTLFAEIKSALEKQTADVVVFGMTEEYIASNGEVYEKVPIHYAENDIFLSTREEVYGEILNLEKKTFYGYAWNKVYRREYLEKINAKFETVVLIEDIVFNINVFNSLQSLIILKSAPYHYMKRTGGNLTNKYVPEYFDVHKRRVNMIFEQLGNGGVLTPEAKSDLGCIYARYIMSAIQRNFDKRANLKAKDRRNFVRKIFDDELYKQTVENAHSENKFVKIILILLKTKSVFALLLLGKALYTVKNTMPTLFSKLKRNK